MFTVTQYCWEIVLQWPFSFFGLCWSYILRYFKQYQADDI